MTATIELREVSLQRDRRMLLDRTSLTVAPGDVAIIAGDPVSAKTALLSICTMTLVPETGEVRLFEQPADAGDVKLRRRIGAAARQPRFLDHMSLLENVALPLRLRGEAPAERRRHAEELLDWVGLGDAAGEPPSALDDGQRRLAGLARAVITSPDLLVADEPAADQDDTVVERVLSTFQALSDQGGAVVVATRDPRLMRKGRRMATARLMELADGRLASPVSVAARGAA